MAFRTRVHHRLLTRLMLATAALLFVCLIGSFLLRTELVTYRMENGCFQILRKPWGRDYYEIRFDSDAFRIAHRLTQGGRIIARPDPIDVRLHVPFELVARGELVVAVPPRVVVGDPVEAFRRLILVFPSQPKAIEFLSINDLRGLVRIRNPKEALAFCRLLTSPATYCYLECPGVEVVSRDQGNLDYCFGDREARESYCDAKLLGYMGVVGSRDDLVSLSIRPASARRTPTGFEVHRTLLVEGEMFTDCRFVDVVETVGRDGSYSRKEIRERPAPSGGKYNFMIAHPM